MVPPGDEEDPAENPDLCELTLTVSCLTLEDRAEEQERRLRVARKRLAQGRGRGNLRGLDGGEKRKPIRQRHSGSVE